MKRLLAIAVLTLATSFLTVASSPIASAFTNPTTDLKLDASLPVGSIIPPVPRPNFEPEATLSADGRHVTLTGESGFCEPNEKTSEVQATILQSSTHASASGVTQDACPKNGRVSFTVVATAPPSKPPFQEGLAQVCGLGLSRSGEHVVDIEFWCTFVTLVKA